MRKMNGPVLRTPLLSKGIEVLFYSSPGTPPILIGACKVVDIEVQILLMFLPSLISMEYKDQFLWITRPSEWWIM